jgi:hypothetical protein
MYSNDMIQIRAGLVNYIGAMIKASQLEGKEANQVIAAALIEEALKLSQLEGNSCDLFVLKPLLRANIFVLKQRCKELFKIESIGSDSKIAIATTIKRYEEIIQTYENITKDL